MRMTNRMRCESYHRQSKYKTFSTHGLVHNKQRFGDIVKSRSVIIELGDFSLYAIKAKDSKHRCHGKDDLPVNTR